MSVFTSVDVLKPLYIQLHLSAQLWDVVMIIYQTLGTKYRFNIESMQKHIWRSVMRIEQYWVVRGSLGQL